jgi:putative oxidoreductase
VAEERLANAGLLLFRVSLGIVFLAHGYLKVFIFGLEQAAEVFANHTVWGYHLIPGWLAAPAAFVEFVGGIMLITGFKTRLATPFLASVAFGAGAVHFENGWNYTSEPDGGWEYGIFLFICAVVVWLVGPGSYTLTAFLAKRYSTNE